VRSGRGTREGGGGSVLRWRGGWGGWGSVREVVEGGGEDVGE